VRGTAQISFHPVTMGKEKHDRIMGEVTGLDKEQRVWVGCLSMTQIDEPLPSP